MKIFGTIIIAFSVVILIPIFTVLSALLQPNLEVWSYLFQHRLGEIIVNTLRLTFGVGICTFVIGTSLAWLMTMYEFPGRSFLEWALILPLAIPSYVLGFVYLAHWDHAGFFPTWIRATFGQDAWYPIIRGYGGLVIVMSLCLYPYVYLLARNAFREQNYSLLECARNLGTKRHHLLWKVALPMARPSLVGGLTLVMMETLADFGTVSMFSYETFTTAIYQIWFGFFERVAAAQLAGMLMLTTFFLFFLEKQIKRQRKYFQIHGKSSPLKPFQLQGYKRWLATSLPMMLVLVSVIYPIGVLLSWVAKGLSEDWNQAYFELVRNTVLIGVCSTVFIVNTALVVAYGRRLFPGKLTQFTGLLVSMGYAIPGSVIAVGILLPFTAFDHFINRWIKQMFDVSVGLLITGSVVGLLIAYLVRFMAVAFNPIDSSLSKITPSMDMAARSLGHNQHKVLAKVHLPLVSGGVFTSFLLVLVEVMKEMPATLLLRPFGFETLATHIWQLTKESYWEEAALSALTIVGAGLLPVILLMKMTQSIDATQFVWLKKFKSHIRGFIFGFAHR